MSTYTYFVFIFYSINTGKQTRDDPTGHKPERGHTSRRRSNYVFLSRLINSAFIARSCHNSCNNK